MESGRPKTCLACGKSLPPDAVFCTNCGARLTDQTTGAACPSCGDPVQPGDAFCTNCGTRFGNKVTDVGAQDSALAAQLIALACDFLSVEKTAPGRFEFSSQKAAQSAVQKVNIRYDAIALLDPEKKQVTFWEKMVETSAGMNAGTFVEKRVQTGAEVSKDLSGHLLSGGKYGFQYGKLRDVVKMLASKEGWTLTTVVFKPGDKATPASGAGKPAKFRWRIPLVVGIALLAVVFLMIYLCSSGDSPLAPKVKTFQQEGVVAEGKPFIETEKQAYTQGEKIRVFFYNAPGSSRDWITVVPAGSPDRQVGPYQYMPQGRKRGIMTFDAMPEGQYEVRAYYRYDTVGYKVATRFAFTVQSQATGR